MLAADAETGDQGTVTLNVSLLDVVQKAAALAVELHKAAARVVVALVNLEVLGEVRNSAGEQRDLNFGRTGVRLVCAVFLNCLRLLSHGVGLTFESEVPMRTASMTTRTVSDADRWKE